MRIIITIVFLLLLVCTSTNTGFAQNSSAFMSKSKTLIQFSGIIMANDSLQPVLYANIWDKNTRRGAVSNSQGFFSFVVHKGDTIRFSAVGYKKASLVVPSDLEENTYSVIQFMQRDTVVLPEAMIYPWPTKEEFRQAFLNAEVPNDDLTRAQRNLEKERMQELALSMKMDGRENYSYQMRQYSASLYSAGQNPHIKVFDVFAWAEFFKALKRGDFKNKNKRKN